MKKYFLKIKAYIKQQRRIRKLRRFSKRWRALINHSKTYQLNEYVKYELDQFASNFTKEHLDELLRMERYAPDPVYLIVSKKEIDKGFKQILNMKNLTPEQKGDQFKNLLSLIITDISKYQSTATEDEMKGDDNRRLWNKMVSRKPDFKSI